jgi:protocatechuate 3,4-dioxygenase beta subunit
MVQMIVVELLLAFGMAAQDMPLQMGTLSGTAVNSVTGAVLGKVELRAIPTGVRFAPMASTTTDAKGNFTLVDLPPGEYRLKALRNGFLDTYYGARRAASEGTLITLQAGQEIKDLRIELAPYSVIAGTVRDPDGEPISGATLTLFAQSFESGHRKITQQGFWENKTDDLGQYRITDLAPGKYYVQATTRIASSDEGDSSVVVIDHSAKSAGPPKVLLPTLYPGVLDPALARIVEVGPGAHLTGIDIPLVRSPTFRVVIHPTAAAGLLVYRPWLHWAGEDDIGLNFTRPAKTREGDFVFSGVPPGSYVLEAPGGPPDDPSPPGVQVINRYERQYRARMPISVDRDIDSISIVVQRGAEVTGHVRVEGETKTKVAGSSISFRTAAGDSGSALIREDGSFATSLSADRYYVELHELNLIIKSVESEGIDVFDGGVTVPETGSVALEIVLAPEGGRVDGVVLDKDEKPVAGATVVLIAGAELRARGDSFHAFTSDQNGHFHFENVRPGDYKLFAWDDVEPNIWFDPEFLKNFEDRGAPVTLPVSGQATVQLHLLASQ